MPKRKHFIQLTTEEINKLIDIIKKGESAALVIQNANILLASNADQDGKMKTQAAVAEQCHVSSPTVSKVRKNYCEHGFEAAIYRKEYDVTNREIKLDGALEAHIISVACSEVPEGFSRWTLRMVADKTVELGYVNEISHTLVARALKKTNFSLI